MSEYFRKYIKKEHYPTHPSTIKFKTTFKNCILESMKRRQWKEAEADEWDLNWAEKEWILDCFDHAHVTSNQRVNHFRNFSELTRKDLMIKNIKKHKKNLEKDNKPEESALYNFTPLTYNLPSEYSIFCEEFKKANLMSDSKQLWIMKPVIYLNDELDHELISNCFLTTIRLEKHKEKGYFYLEISKKSALGRILNDITLRTHRYIIILIKKLVSNYDWMVFLAAKADPYVVQKYISEPLLIGGKKFDMRIYALCVSYQPLTVYLYRTGFARFTHHRYDLDDINNAYVHLTNVAIQKNSENYDEKLGGKWLLQTLKLYLISKYGQEKVSEAFFQIQNIIIKALQAVQKVMINDKRCFELYGFDVLLDAQLKPWLLEINSSPSMTANTQVDSELKINLLDDAFTIIDLEKILTGQEEQIGGFDLIFKGNMIKLPSNSSYSSLLGCYNNRNQQLKKLAKSTSIRLAQAYQEQQLQQQQQNLQQQQKQNELNKQRSNSKGPTANFTQNMKQNSIPIKSGYSRYNAAKLGPQKLEKKVVLNKPNQLIPNGGQQPGQPFLAQNYGQKPPSSSSSIGNNTTQTSSTTINTTQTNNTVAPPLNQIPLASLSNQPSLQARKLQQLPNYQQQQQSLTPISKPLNSQSSTNSKQQGSMMSEDHQKQNDQFQRYIQEEEQYHDLLKNQNNDEE